MTWPLDDAAAPPSSRGGMVLAGRYRLSRVLGSGSFGEVWCADDLVTKRAVAVKLLHPDVELSQSRAHLEALALRQRLPGVVELLDEGNEGDLLFLVMELVDGQPFPGRNAPCAWSDIADVVVALLSTLARVHAAFVIHRDLKPANVLVTPDRQVRILDFGIAYQPSGVEGDSEDGSEILGTPAYMAPEQLRRQPLSERTDIHALGWMLYEALAGKLPHDGPGGRVALWTRLNRRAPPLLDLAPSVPPNVARIVDRMVALDPKERPASALEVLALLRGENAVEDPLFPWLGARTALDAVLRAGRESRCLDVVGAPGHGRTRVLLAAKQVLSTRHRAHFIAPGAEQGLTTEWARGALERGEVILVDDFELLSPASREVVRAVRSAGVLIRALREPEESEGDVVTLRPLHEAELRSLFAGPDRLLHLREDAARELYRRTDGVPARVVREVTEWLNLGIARWARSLLVVPRSVLDRLAAGMLDGDVGPDAARANGPVSGQAGGPPSAGGLRRSRDAARPESARLSIAREAAALATSWLDEGRLGEAVAAIERGLRAVRGCGPVAAAETSSLLALWAEAALEEGTPHAVDRLLYALHRADSTPHTKAIEGLALSMKVEEIGTDRAMTHAEPVAPCADPRLERVRVRVLMRGGFLRADEASEDALLDGLARSEAARDEETAARIDHARGRLRYRQGRYLEAASLHESAAARPGSVLRRVEAMCAAAWALLEAFELDRAEAIAAEARALAAKHRHATYETYATWSLRAVAYRKGAAGGPDMELVAAVQYAVGRRVQGNTLLIEAAAAWRSGDSEGARLAEASCQLLSAIDDGRGTFLARCLTVALGVPASDADVAALHHRALVPSGVGLGIQALGLVAIGGRLLPELVPEGRLLALAEEIPRPFWDIPVDVLSVNEALSALRRAGVPGLADVLAPPGAVPASS